MDRTGELGDIVRRADRDRYIADLYAPEAVRPHLLALHAFDAEVARTPFAVTEPALGEIRLQWWRDALSGAGEAGGHPVATALLETMEVFHLPVAAFDSILAARVFDLYADPMPTLADFEGYAGETVSAPIQLAAIILAGGDDPGSAVAAGHAGVALGLTKALLRFPLDLRRGRLFLPRDRLEARGVDVAALTTGGKAPDPRLAAALAELRDNARRHAAAAREALAPLPASLRPAFLPLELVEPDLRRLERGVARPLEPVRPIAGWRRQLMLARAARR